MKTHKKHVSLSPQCLDDIYDDRPFSTKHDVAFFAFIILLLTILIIGLVHWL